MYLHINPFPGHHENKEICYRKASNNHNKALKLSQVN